MNNNNQRNYTKDFIEFLEEATTPYHVVKECENKLVKAGFKKLYMKDYWSVGDKGKYYVMPYPNMIAAFTVASKMDKLNRFKIITSHIDSPGFKVKPLPEINFEGYLKLNTEVYGGPILNTWMDRLLSIGGIVTLKSDDIFKPQVRLIDFKRPIVTIPNLAIHMNNKINDGIEINRQKDLLPILATINNSFEHKQYLLKLIAEELDVSVDDILDFDLNIYLAEKASIVGVDKSMLSGPRLDNLTSVYASIEAIINSECNEGINMAICFDNEEIGSMTLQGADSSLVSIITKRILDAYNRTENQYYRMLDKSFIISADGAHALHPNAPEKNDITNKCIINKGVAIKISGKKSYASDSESIAIFQQLAERTGVSVQKYINNSNVRGGQTLGPIVSSHLPIRTVDIGLPMLAMHSARELIGLSDFNDSIKIFKEFYNL